MPLAGPVMTTTRFSRESFMGWSVLCQVLMSGIGPDRSRAFAQWRQEAAVEDFANHGRARQFLGLDHDVDRLCHAFVADVADADLGDLRMAHLVGHRRVQPRATMADEMSHPE